MAVSTNWGPFCGGLHEESLTNLGVLGPLMFGLHVVSIGVVVAGT